MRTAPPAARARRHVPAHPIRRPSELHILGCDCPACEPPVPSVVPALTGRQVLGLGAAGFAVGHALAFAYDPTGTAAIVADLFRWWFL